MLSSVPLAVIFLRAFSLRVSCDFGEVYEYIYAEGVCVRGRVGLRVSACKRKRLPASPPTPAHPPINENATHFSQPRCLFCSTSLLRPSKSLPSFLPSLTGCLQPPFPCIPCPPCQAQTPNPHTHAHTPISTHAHTPNAHT